MNPLWATSSSGPSPITLRAEPLQFCGWMIEAWANHREIPHCSRSTIWRCAGGHRVSKGRKEVDRKQIGVIGHSEGGMVGPLIINHVRCNRCGTAYNGNHGDSNTTRIVLYIVASFGIALAFVALAAVAQVLK